MINYWFEMHEHLLKVDTMDLLYDVQAMSVTVLWNTMRFMVFEMILMMP